MSSSFEKVPLQAAPQFQIIVTSECALRLVHVSVAELEMATLQLEDSTLLLANFGVCYRLKVMAKNRFNANYCHSSRKALLQTLAFGNQRLVEPSLKSSQIAMRQSGQVGFIVA